MTDIANELDTKRAALLDDARERIADDIEAGGDTDDVLRPDSAAVAMIDEAEKLRETADAERVAAAVTKERDASTELAAQLLATAPTPEPSPSPADQIRALGTGGGRSLHLRVDIGAAAKFASAAINGVTARDMLGAQQRAYSIGTNSAGGFLVPDTLAMTIYQSMRTIQGVRAAGAEVMTTASGEPYELPKIATFYNPEGVLEGAEGTALTSTEDTFSTQTWNAYKYTSQAILSRELLQDHGTNLESLIGVRLGEIVAEKEERRFTSGSGVSQPQGAVTGTPAANTTTAKYTATGTNATNAPTYAELAKAVGSIEPKYVARGLTWMLNSEVFYRLVAVTDTRGQPVHQPRTIDRPFDTILGHRVSYNNYLPKYGATSNIILLGDFYSGYLIRDVGTYDLAVSSEVRFLEQQVVFQGTHRCDGQVRDAAALHLVKTA